MLLSLNYGHTATEKVPGPQGPFITIISNSPTTVCVTSPACGQRQSPKPFQDSEQKETHGRPRAQACGRPVLLALGYEH